MMINKGTCMLLYDAIPGDRNVIKKEAETILKYKGLITEIQAATLYTLETWFVAGI